MNGPFEDLIRSLDALDAPAVPIRQAIDLSITRQRSLLDGLPDRLIDPDCSLVVFGSTARGEATTGSDVDWTLLIDGAGKAEHRRVARQIARVLKDLRLKDPRAGGAFGEMAISHDAIHKIGGEADSNRNLTQRALLILESAPIVGDVVRTRVIRLILQRYVQDETSFLTETGKRERVHRFLLNDVIRFWRTMAVDYASKRIERGDEGWAIRNAKLRFSRKLLLVAGLAICLAPKLRPSEKLRQAQTADQIEEALIDLLIEYQDQVPLAIVIQLFREFASDDLAREFLDCYGSFLTILDTQRLHLEELDSEDPGRDPVFSEIRTQSRRFQNTLDRLFFESNNDLTALVIRYGVF